MTFCGVVGATFETAAVEVTVRVQVSDDGFDSGAAAQLALYDTKDSALLAGDEDRRGFCASCPRYPLST
jgi:hypothetical protein